jgi:hypothetical protein
VSPTSRKFRQLQRSTNSHFLATPYALLLGDGAPILQVRGGNWPFLHPIRGNGPALSVWMPAGNIPIPNARASRPCLLKSSLPISWITESSEYFDFKDQVIRWVNRNLSKANDATSEVTIGVILCLMSWEVSQMSLYNVYIYSFYLQIVFWISNRFFLSRSPEETPKS